MPAIYDSGWRPAASGALTATILPDSENYMLVVAASGASGSNIGAKWYAGSETPVPYLSRNPAYTCLPLPTGDFSLTATQAADASTFYTFGPGLSGSTNWKGPAWPRIAVSGVAASGGFFRVIVEGQ